MAGRSDTVDLTTLARVRQLRELHDAMLRVVPGRTIRSMVRRDTEYGGEYLLRLDNGTTLRFWAALAEGPVVAAQLVPVRSEDSGQ